MILIYSSALCGVHDVISLVWCDWRWGSPTVGWSQDDDHDENEDGDHDNDEDVDYIKDVDDDYVNNEDDDHDNERMMIM